jgi:WD repeat-containing protein 19
MLYDHHHSRKIPILGKHSKRVVSGAWSDHRLLALIGEDRVLSISNEEGDTLTTTLLKGEPSQIQFGRLIGGGFGSIQSDLEMDLIRHNLLDSETNKVHSEADNCISIVLNRRQLLLLSVQSPSDQPTILAFADKYGDLLQYEWLTERDQLLVAFQNGFVALLSTSASHVGQELAYVKVFKETLHHVAVSQSTGKLAAINGST